MSPTLCFLLLGVALLAGCPGQAPLPVASAPRTSVTLRILVVNDPPLVEAVNRLRGEWSERSGGELIATGTSWKDLSSAKNIDADLVIFPSRYLGEFCTRDWLRPVRANVLESNDVKAIDFFPIIRNELIKWGGEVLALPLGVGHSALDSAAPSTPPVVALLALAAPHAISNDRIGVLFDTETMKPRITEPAFVDALVELAARKTSDAPIKTDSQLPVLGYADRLAAVTLSTRNAASAFRLLEWLAHPDTSAQFARVGTEQLPARRSLASSAAWYEPNLSASDRADRGKSLDKALSGQQYLLVPRIPAIDDYLAALSDAIDATDKSSAAAALQNVARRWEQITDAHGRDKQRDAYLKELNIADK